MHGPDLILGKPFWVREIDANDSKKQVTVRRQCCSLANHDIKKDSMILNINMIVKKLEEK